MAKKNTEKKTTRKSNSPKTRKPRAPQKPKVTITADPAIDTLVERIDELSQKIDLNNSDFVFHTNTENQCCGGNNRNIPWWRKADIKMDQFKNWVEKKIKKISYWAFDYPLAFTVSVLGFFIVVTAVVLYLSRK